MHPLWLLSAHGKFGEDQLLCSLFERAPGTELVSAAPAMNARTVGERPWGLDSRRAASPARKQNAHASEDPRSPMQDSVPSERHGSTHSEHDVVSLHAGSPCLFLSGTGQQRGSELWAANKGVARRGGASERGVFFRLQPRHADRVVSPHQIRASSSGLITRGES